jgi:arylsulfatase A-like enzyme
MPRTGSNYPLRGHKAQLYEGGIRTPAIISWPGRLAPCTLRTPINIVDWLPTFVSLLGLEHAPDAPLDGTDVSRLLSDPEAAIDRPPMYWNLRHRRFAVRRGQWKLIVRHRSDCTDTELYDLEGDPFEERNVADDNPTVVTELRALLDRMRQSDDSSKRPDTNR